MAVHRLTAAEPLERARLDLGVVRAALPRVDPRRVPVRVAPLPVRLLWGRIAAVAMAWGIYVRPEIMARHHRGDDPMRTAELIVHELTHLEQWRRLGPVRHSVQYVADYVRGRLRGLSHWEAYRAIRHEAEARQTARMVTAAAASTGQ